MLHNICISAVAMSLRWAACGPWASCCIEANSVDPDQTAPGSTLFAKKKKWLKITSRWQKQTTIVVIGALRVNGTLGINELIHKCKLVRCNIERKQIEQSDLGPHCFHLSSQADEKADYNCCDWRVKKVNQLWCLKPYCAKSFENIRVLDPFFTLSQIRFDFYHNHYHNHNWMFD